MRIIILQGDIEKRNNIYYEYDADAKPLGEGGMGRVFKGYRVAEKTGERTPVAIKAIYDNIPERVVERARREAGICLTNDNLIHMLGFVETVNKYDGGTRTKVNYHVIMELLIGVTLEDIMNGITSDQNGLQIPFAAEIYSQYMQDRDKAVVRIMKSVLSGLMALHDNGYIHRDIDPSNIMVTMDGKIKLIDFGICKQVVSLESLDKALTASGVFMGKVNYAAPELVIGDVRSQNYTTDIYAMGILLYQLTTGRLPFSGTDQDILSANLHKNLPLKNVKNKDIKKIIRKSTEKSQSKRYSSVAEFRVDIERVKPQVGSNGKLLLTIGVILSVLLIIGGVYVYKNKTEIKEAEKVVVAPTCEELYEEAISLLSNKDSLHLISKGKEQLRVLVEDSVFLPAQMKYYVLLLNSNIQNDVRKGYDGLRQMAESDTLNSRALFECGLTLSKSNSTFSVPDMRQVILGIQPDLATANQLLIKAMNADTTDYKSVYWAFNNMMELKLDGTLSTKDDKELARLYHLFEKRSEMVNDSTVMIYKNAIKNDGITLKAWGLIK